MFLSSKDNRGQRIYTSLSIWTPSSSLEASNANHGMGENIHTKFEPHTPAFTLRLAESQRHPAVHPHKSHVTAQTRPHLHHIWSPAFSLVSQSSQLVRKHASAITCICFHLVVLTAPLWQEGREAV